MGNRQFVRVAISVLTDKTIIVASSNVMSKALHAALFGYMGEKFKKTLIDPLDKPASCRKTYERILGFLTSTFFNENSEEIARGCAISMKEILENVFPEYLVEPEKFELFNTVFIDPLKKFLLGTGQNKNAVAASSYCLRYLINHLISTKPTLITKPFAAKFTNMAIKRSIVQYSFVELLRDLMKHFGLGVNGIAPNNGK